MLRKGRFISIATLVSLIILNMGFISALRASVTITGTEDPETNGVWLFSAGTDTTPGGQPTDEIIMNAITAVPPILDFLGDEASEVVAFNAGPPDTSDVGSRDTTLALVVEGLTTIDDFGYIDNLMDPSSNFDAGVGGWVQLGNFGEIHPDGVIASGTIGPDSGVDPEVALAGFEIFLFEDAELSGFTCVLTPKTGSPITFAITDRQVNPSTPYGADDTLIAIDLDSLGLSETNAITGIKITDDAITMAPPPLYPDTTLELDAVATRVSLLIVPGSISGYKWNDENENGVWDSGEEGLSGWTIKLSGDEVDSTVTSSSGYYIFDNLLPGSYTVSETLKTGWTRTYPTGSGTYSRTLNSGDNVQNLNFGNMQLPPSVGGRGEVIVSTTTAYYVNLILAFSLVAALSYQVARRIKPIFF